MLQTRYNQVPLRLEEGGGEILVETAGYVPSDVRIREFIEAGVRLAEYRREAYDFGEDEEVDMSAVDPFRSKSIDMAEISEAKLLVEERIRRKKTAIAEVKETVEERDEKPEAE